jgi:glutathione S-transferase
MSDAEPMRAPGPTLFGAAYSVYVRIARLALAEKGVAYEHVEIDVFAPGGPPAEYLRRHPFGRIPAFEHAGFRLYETGAIARYVDEAFAGVALQPGDVCARARINQIISVLDNYAYPTLVWGVYVARSRGDEEKVAAALPRARTCVVALAELLGDATWLAGAALSLADLYAAPMFAYFRRAPEAELLLAGCDNLQRWWERMAGRSSMATTEPAQ